MLFCAKIIFFFHSCSLYHHFLLFLYRNTVAVSIDRYIYHEQSRTCALHHRQDFQEPFHNRKGGDGENLIPPQTEGR